jgi:CRISPR system Cascade subunit CasC
MTEPRFIQIHWLASYPGTLLNRDDSGLAKALPFGGVTRTRISSQCLKRTWRKAKDAMNIGLMENIETAERSREHIERQVINGLAEETGKPADIVMAVGLAFIEALYGDKAKDRKNRQALLLGWPEIRYMRKEAIRLVTASLDKKDAEARCKDYFGKDGIRRVFRAVRSQCAQPGGFEAALFGRMVTSDPEANIEGALHVAHAITVHRAEKELDLVTVADDLKTSSDAGAAGVFDSELTSGVYYGYAVIDVPTLVSNLSGVPAKQWLSPQVDRETAAEVAARLVHLIATVSPGAKRGATAPYSYAEAMLVEAGNRQPRTLANAFRNEIPLKGDVGKEALKALSAHALSFDLTYGPAEVRAGFSVGDGLQNLEAMKAAPKTLAGLSDWVRNAIRTGQA